MLAQEVQTETGVGVGSSHSVLPKQLSSVLEFRMRNCASPVPWGVLLLPPTQFSQEKWIQMKLIWQKE